MKNYIKVRDLIEAVEDFHQQLEAFYARLAESTDRDRVQLLLDYMRDREHRFREGMAEYDDDGAEDVLETRLQYGPDDDELVLPRVEQIGEDVTVDEVVQMVIRFDDELTSFYDDALRLAKPEKVQRLFRALAAQQESEKAHMLKVGSTGLRDM